MNADELHTGWVTTVTSDWTQARTRLEHLDVCYTDDHGLHITNASNLPMSQPRTCTHLWGWATDRMVHLRLDNTTVYITELSTANPDGTAQQVTYRTEHSLTFRTAEGESAALRLAPDTDPIVLGGPAAAHIIVDGPRLAFLST